MRHGETNVSCNTIRKNKYSIRFFCSLIQFCLNIIQSSSIYYVPGHFTSSQFSVTASLPMQDFPVPDGSGEEHVRLLDFIPIPQLALQPPHELHSDHPPSTPVGFVATNL
jgi:hypothetical protein